MKIRTDLILHFLCACLITNVLSMIVPIWYAVAVALVVSVGKELADKYLNLGTAEWADFLADLIGIAVGVAIFYGANFANSVL